MHNGGECQCASCVHGERFKGIIRYCPAFPLPDGVPVEIWSNDVVHDHVVAGQVGDTTYEVKDGAEAF